MSEFLIKELKQNDFVVLHMKSIFPRILANPFDDDCHYKTKEEAEKAKEEIVVRHGKGELI